MSAYHPAGQVIYIHFFHQVIVIHGGSRDIVAFVRTYVIKAEIIGKPILSVPGNDAASLDTDDQASVFHINFRYDRGGRQRVLSDVPCVGIGIESSFRVYAVAEYVNRAVVLVDVGYNFGRHVARQSIQLQQFRSLRTPSGSLQTVSSIGQSDLAFLCPIVAQNLMVIGRRSDVVAFFSGPAPTIQPSVAARRFGTFLTVSRRLALPTVGYGVDWRIIVVHCILIDIRIDNETRHVQRVFFGVFFHVLCHGFHTFHLQQFREFVGIDLVNLIAFQKCHHVFIRFAFGQSADLVGQGFGFTQREAERDGSFQGFGRIVQYSCLLNDPFIQVISPCHLFRVNRSVLQCHGEIGRDLRLGYHQPFI